MESQINIANVSDMHTLREVAGNWGLEDMGVDRIREISLVVLFLFAAIAFFIVRRKK